MASGVGIAFDIELVVPGVVCDVPTVVVVELEGIVDGGGDPDSRPAFRSLITKNICLFSRKRQEQQVSSTFLRSPTSR